MSESTRKLKQYCAQRGTEVIKLSELKKIAEQALTDKAFHNNFKCRYRQIDLIGDTFGKLHINIINTVSTQENPDLDAQNQIFTDFQNDFFHVQAIYTQLFDVDDSTRMNITLSSPVTRQQNVRLPKLELPKFGGDLRTWQTFHDMYVSLIHGNDALSSIDKFNYLLSSLENAPLALVKRTPLTGDNYEVAYQKLVKRYDNKRLIATSHWHAIEYTKKLDVSDDPNALRCLVDTFNENTSILQNLGYKVDSWDFILFNMLIDRLDSATATRFEIEHGSTLEQNDCYTTLVDFIQKQCEALDTVGFSNSPQNKKQSVVKSKISQHFSQPNYVNNRTRKSSSFFSNSSKQLCQVCQADHLIYNCPTFIAKTPNERYALAKENKWCSNCLGFKHSSSKCTSNSHCKKCSLKHHTMLHFEKHSAPTVGSGNNANSSTHNPTLDTPMCSTQPSVNLLSHENDRGVSSTVLLSTALVEMADINGEFHTFRAILDSASQSNFITHKCVQNLGLKPFLLNTSICGIGQTNSTSSRGISGTVKPVNSNNPVFTLDFVILSKLCSNMPCVDLSKDLFEGFSHLELADPNFSVSQPVDILLGADIFGFLLKGRTFCTSINEPVAIDTIFGWVIMGKVSNSIYSKSLAHHTFLTSTEFSLENLVKQFWQLEQIPTASTRSPEETMAEKHFVETFTRTETGRFKLLLPFRISNPIFEGSRDIALRRFFTVERRLLNNPELYEHYKSFMQDYLDSHHMERIPESQIDCPSAYYIPHLCVVRPESKTTKIRVVFDASSKCLNNISLNQTLLTGPKLQHDIIAVLLRFRLNAVAFTADIKQMYRQILISEEHQNYQRILWRFSKNELIQDFKLLTVSFGVSCAPFQALRVLQELANINKLRYPLASRILKSDIFVDDVVTSCETLDEAKNIQHELMSLLGEAGFELRKWASNNPTLLCNLPSDSLQYDPLSLDLENESTIKILGLQWNPLQDVFSYKVVPLQKPCTKRNVLSQLARVYDPLGFLTPLTLYLKLVIQKIWARGIDWDTLPPQDILDIWNQFQAELSTLLHLKIPRHMNLGSHVLCEVHGYCDASERGYSGVAYLRTIGAHNEIKVSLICAKSKVAPLKKISIPKLELCGALLLANLLKFILDTLSDKTIISRVFAWTDSTIVLSWIKSSPHQWETFVCNRTTQIQERIPPSNWYHIKSEYNPADPASRGLLPSDLLNCELWWAGPPWLTSPADAWPFDINDMNFLPETNEGRRSTALTIAVDECSLLSLLERFSSLAKIQRILAFVLRFVNNTRKRELSQSSSVSLMELEQAMNVIIKLTQRRVFSQEISLLKGGKPLPKHFRKLTPFLDTQGVLRVGGRLVHSSLPFERKHPALLPNSHRLTHLIIEYTHSRFLHPGLQTLQNLLLQRYWILSPKRAIRRVISGCMKCFRLNPTFQAPLMGNLPAPRVSQLKPFSHTGIDMAGPFHTTLRKVRGAKTHKSYLCIFVCMATKAIHIELVSDLTAEAFLAALRRFIARRGRCCCLYSDSGSNFIASSKYISSLMHSVAEEEHIKFKINCPRAPNFGGLWESGIKSIKSHLYRVVGDQILTFEELYTVLVQIEAVLNSRPLCPLSSDPHDLQALTPGHFLTLEPLNALPDPNLEDIKIGRLSRWQLLQKMHQSFWNRWHREYLHTLLQRSKWTDSTTSIEPGTLVILKDELIPPLKWPLARITAVHPGPDKVTRVVTVRTTKGTYTRPVSKVCPLPNQ